GIPTGQSRANEHAVEIKARLTIRVNHRDVYPSINRRVENQQRRHIAIAVFKNADSVRPDRNSCAHYSASWRLARENRVALSAAASKSRRAFRRAGATGGWPGPQ